MACGVHVPVAGDSMCLRRSPWQAGAGGGGWFQGDRGQPVLKALNRWKAG